jgi:ammonium transporter, Amt family
VAITPASGFVSPWAAIIIGAAAGIVCYMAVVMKNKFGYDDSLDAFGVHGVGGFLGAVLTGVFASMAFNPGGGRPGWVDGAAGQVWRQLVAALSAAAIASIGTLILLVLIDKTMGLRISRRVEIEGMDPGIHGEQGWMLDPVPAPTVELPGGSSSIDVVAARPKAEKSVPTH